MKEIGIGCSLFYLLNSFNLGEVNKLFDSIWKKTSLSGLNPVLLRFLSYEYLFFLLKTVSSIRLMKFIPRIPSCSTLRSLILFSLSIHSLLSMPTLKFRLIPPQILLFSSDYFDLELVYYTRLHAFHRKVMNK